MPDPIVPFDLSRMFLGDAPTLFHLEIVVRTVLVYAYAFAMVRWIGGRSVAQLTTVEFLLVIALGSAVGDPMFYPDVPIAHALITITVVVLVNKVLDMLALKSDWAEKKINGLPIVLVSDGHLVLENMRAGSLGRSELFKLLRLKGFANLGEIRLAVQEANGDVSCYRYDAPRAGLPIVPPEELTGTLGRDDLDPLGETDDGTLCARCGTPRGTAAGRCGCGAEERVRAYRPSADKRGHESEGRADG